MTRSINMNITSPNNEFPYQKAFPAEMPLVEFKRRIELIAGIYVADMSLTLLDKNSKFVQELKAEGNTLEELGVKDGYTIKVDDTSGKLANPMSGDVKKYEINEDRYTQRDNIFRNFKKTAVLPHIVVGNRCVVHSKSKGERTGTIAYVGEVDFKPEIMVGVVLDHPLGKHDGEVDGKRYFQCESPYGIFVDRQFVKPFVNLTASTATNESATVEPEVEEM